MEIKVIAFDADDTLWDCQTYFEAVENRLYELIAPYCDDPARELYLTESANMADLGYGCKAFTLSVVETALRVGDRRTVGLAKQGQGPAATARYAAAWRGAYAKDTQGTWNVAYGVLHQG